MKTYACREEMDDLYHATVLRMMEAHGYRAVAAARLLGHGLRYVPAVRWMRVVAGHARDLVEHYETVSRMYESFTGESMEPVVNARLAERPAPLADDWTELALAQCLYGRAVLCLLREHDGCSFVPFREVTARLARVEAGWQVPAERAAIEACVTGTGAGHPDRQALFDKWLRLSLVAFGRPNTPGNVYALAVGLKRREPGAVMLDYLADLRATVSAAGLRFPAMVELGDLGVGDPEGSGPEATAGASIGEGSGDRGGSDPGGVAGARTEASDESHGG